MARLTRITAPLNTTDLIEVVANDLGISQAEAATNVTAVFDVIARAAAGGHNTAITNFGTFVSYRRARHQARNPQTGDAITVPARQVVKFRPSPRLLDAVRRKNRKATIRKLAKGTLTRPGANSGER